MKTTIKYVVGLIMTGTLLTACSQKKEQSLDEMLQDANQQEKVLTMMAENHDLSSKYISKMMKNDHATGMMVDKLVKAAAADSVLAGKMSDMITKFPNLMLMTMHHFMPVINADEQMCDGFCNHVMKQPKIADGMCHEMKENEKMSCCH